ncbi:FkbM family methyltransferase [Synechocystis sp. PCC 7339]|uniref:FkbM family methyltransferase n=1 Tax=Synechocystis sp. PCC 7339 TaxID=2782213 RepID=UPI001CC09B60|nr:FkbM family methyltransferase [Synechocystis sp. PCC 7339]UAJ72561.1 FkbM family methyltransferase [Synechocystis sp. PCC 7339]
MTNKKSFQNIELYLVTVGFRGLVKTLIAKVKNKTDLLEISNENTRWPIYLRIPSSDVPTYKQIFVDNEYNCTTNRPPKTIIDAGANIGLASVYFANKYPTAKIFAIEPESKNFKLLLKNISDYENIVPIQAALWNENEEINLVDSGLGNWGYMTDADAVDKDICHQVQGVTIDEIMNQYDLEEIDILKVDIEGAEKEVFADPSLWIDKINSFIIELHDFMKPGCGESFYAGIDKIKPNLTMWRREENLFASKKDFLCVP